MDQLQLEEAFSRNEQLIRCVQSVVLLGIRWGCMDRNVMKAASTERWSGHD